jgi:hypothetical protein
MVNKHFRNKKEVINMTSVQKRFNISDCKTSLYLFYTLYSYISENKYVYLFIHFSSEMKYVRNIRSNFRSLFRLIHFNEQ